MMFYRVLWLSPEYRSFTFIRIIKGLDKSQNFEKVTYNFCKAQNFDLGTLLYLLFCPSSKLLECLGPRPVILFGLVFMWQTTIKIADISFTVQILKKSIKQFF